LPGICDSEEKNNNFNKITYDNIINANLIFWCSDVRNAFITTHEVSEFEKLKDYLDSKSYENDTLYELHIILTKCSESFDFSNFPNIDSYDLCDKEDTDEITNLNEDTNIKDIYEKTKLKFKNTDIILFNAFGRGYHNKKSSFVFKMFIKKTNGIPSKENIKFSITPYYGKKYDIKYNIHIEFLFSKKLKEFIFFNKHDFEKIKLLYQKLEIKCKFNMFHYLLSNPEIDYKINPSNYYKNYFDFVIYVYEYCIEKIDNNFLELIEPLMLLDIFYDLIILSI
jgi:hypothetical protein